MPPDVRHLFVSPVAAGTSNRLVQGPDWNEAHNLQQGPAALLGRSDSTPGQAPTQEVLLDPSLAFVGGKLTVTGSVRTTSAQFGCAAASPDNTAALNAFFAACAGGMPGELSPFTHQFQSALAPVVGDNIDIEGTVQSRLLYTGASTAPGDLLTFGDGSGPWQRLSLRNFTIESSTTLTAGYAIKITRYEHVDFDLWVGDEFSQGWKLYNGTWFDKGDLFYLHTSHFYAANEALVWSGGIEMHCGSAFIKGNGGTGTAVHIGGGTGGFNGENLQQLNSNIGLLVDTAITGTANNQIFLGDADFDTNTTVGIRLNDALAGSKVFRFDNCWLATTANGLEVTAWNTGVIDINGGTITNNSGNAIQIAEATATYAVANAASIQGNTGFGIAATVPVIVFCHARLSANTGGTANANVTLRAEFNSAVLVGYGAQVPFSSVGGTTNVTPQMQLAYSNLSAFSIQRYSAGVNPPILNISKSATNTVGAQTIVQGTDVLGHISFNGSDGVKFIEGAYIRAEVDNPATPALNDMPTRLTFGTTADGAATPTTRMTIANNGAVTLTSSLIAVAGNFTDRVKVSKADDALTLAVSGTTKGVRIGTDSTGGRIEGVDSTLSGSLQPLYLGGSAVSVGPVLTTLSATAVAAGSATQAFVKASSTANLGIYYGTGVPSFSAAKGSIYSCTNATTTTTRLYVNTDGAGTWTNLTTAA